MKWPETIVHIIIVAWGIFLLILPQLKCCPERIIRDCVAFRCLAGLIICIGILSFARHVPSLTEFLSAPWMKSLEKLRILLIGIATGIFLCLVIGAVSSRGSRLK